MSEEATLPEPTLQDILPLLEEAGIERYPPPEGVLFTRWLDGHRFGLYDEFLEIVENGFMNSEGDIRLESRFLGVLELKADGQWHLAPEPQD